MNKKKIAVFFGGKSFEHDVSILTGLEVIDSVDSTLYEPFAVYVDLNNNWWVGQALLNKKSYPLNAKVKKKLHRVNLLKNEDGKYCLKAAKKFVFAKEFAISFDVAFLAFHGDYGEDGCFQGLMETMQIPYSGCRVLTSALAMNKQMTKKVLRSVNVPVLPDTFIARPALDEFYDIEKIVKTVKMPFPLIVKPNALGSSVGVSMAKNQEELQAALLHVFALGADALIEPFVENLEEYNIAVTKAFGKVRTSVIERPLKKDSAFLGFKEKYLLGGGCKGTKSAEVNSDGMLSLSRVFCPPELTKKNVADIENWAKTAFEAVQATGVIRIDFLCNSKTKEFYLCELNTIPGSFAFYLWQASEPKVAYTELLSALIAEAQSEADKRYSHSVKLGESKIFKEK